MVVDFSTIAYSAFNLTFRKGGARVSLLFKSVQHWILGQKEYSELKNQIPDVQYASDLAFIFNSTLANY